MRTNEILAPDFEKYSAPQKFGDRANLLQELEFISLQLRVIGCFDNPVEATDVYQVGRKLADAIGSLRLALELRQPCSA